MARHPRPLLSEPEEGAWFGFLSLHARITRELDTRLAGEHGMTLVEFEVLLKLSIAGGRMRMSELADAALLSRSGLTRIVDELEALGLISRQADESDGRVLIATMTETGRRRFLAARRTHLANVRELFLDRLSAAQLATLGEVWSTLLAGLRPETGRRPRPAAAATARSAATTRG